jgi:hypothetical protein
MFKRFVVPALLIGCISGVWAAAVPRYAVELGKDTGPTNPSEKLTRMRISVVGEMPQAERSVRIGDLILCSSAQCYRARTPGYVNIENTAKGKADVIADGSIPIATITDVYFAEVGGASVVMGRLKLEKPLAIDENFPGVELMISVRKQHVATVATYVPVQSASMYFADDSELVHYLPSVQTVADLSLGTTLTIPAGALERPQIFNVGIAKIGEMFPKIDILPYVALKKAASIEVRALRNSSDKQQRIVPVIPAGRNDNLPMLTVPAAQRSAKFEFYRTAVIEPSVLE